MIELNCLDTSEQAHLLLQHLRPPSPACCTSRFFLSNELLDALKLVAMRVHLGAFLFLLNAWQQQQQQQQKQQQQQYQDENI
jgi:hypothetical protein